jgi:hypothetical protein
MLSLRNAWSGKSMAKHVKETPVAFVSYSWDSPGHKEWVRELAERLAESGVDVILDQWHLGPGQSVTHFMESSIKRAEFIVVVCTPNYARRSNARKGGVGYEQQIISGHMAQGLKTKRFVPVLRRGTLQPGRNNAVPTHLSGIYAVDLRKAEGSEEELENLIRAIFAKPRYRPPSLGKAPIFTRATPTRKRRLKSTVVRLPNSEMDGYSLRSGVASAERYPKTFHIPPAFRRARLDKGDIVKLIFEYADESEQEIDGLSGERMWVKITGTKAPYLVGKLVSQPIGQDNKGWPLTWGDRVLFLPEHVIDIEP